MEPNDERDQREEGRLILWILGLLACDEMGHMAAKAVPALEKVDPSWGAPRVDCDAIRITQKPIRGCVSETIKCGDIIDSTTQGGGMFFGDDFFQHGQCTPQRNDYELSPEAIYQLRLQPNVKAVIRLDSNCADLDPFAVAWTGSKCPNADSTIRECEFDDKAGGGTITITTVENPQVYLVGVDGKYGAAANFRLTVECSLYR